MIKLIDLLLKKWVGWCRSNLAALLTGWPHGDRPREALHRAGLHREDHLQEARRREEHRLEVCDAVIQKTFRP